MNMEREVAILRPSLPSPRNMQVFHPHDLLWVTDWHALHASAPLPAWVNAEWMVRAPVVVRREEVEGTALIPVGLRGRQRSERLSAYLESGAVLRRLSPEMLARQAAWRRMSCLECLPATAALERIAPLLDSSGLSWGPTGSMGFALASGLPALREQSDLDILVRCDAPFTRDQTQMLAGMFDGHTCRIDMQIDSGHGGFAFAEWTRNHGRVLLKTGLGPFLTSDPWNRAGWLDTAGRDAA
jgi:phosphoribosyl-dephospho-CoA transferase